MELVKPSNLPAGEIQRLFWKTFVGVPGVDLGSASRDQLARAGALLLFEIWPAMSASDHAAYREQAASFWRDQYCESFPWGRWSDADEWLHRLALPYAVGIVTDEIKVYPDLDASDTRSGRLVYRAFGHAFQAADFEKFRGIVEQSWAGPVIIEPGIAYGGRPGTVSVRPQPPLPAQIHLRANRADIVVGTDWLTGEDVALPVDQIASTLVAGSSGYGKSVLMHALLSQLLASSGVGQVFAIDLKYGIEFARYRNRKLQLIDCYENITPAIDRITSTMVHRYAELLRLGKRTFKGLRIFVMIDEYAQIHYPPGDSREERAAHSLLIAKLNKLSMQGRAAGIVIVAATQRATSDFMDAAMRTNLINQICFHVPNNTIAALMFGTTENLRANPIELPVGRCIFRNGLTGETHYLQTHLTAGATD